MNVRPLFVAKAQPPELIQPSEGPLDRDARCKHGVRRPDWNRSIGKCRKDWTSQFPVTALGKCSFLAQLAPSARTFFLMLQHEAAGFTDA